MILAALALLADLAVSVAPAKDVLITDELFRVAVRVHNRGTAEAKDVKLKIGVNTLTYMNELAAPKGWTCENGPVFGYALTCTASTLAAGESAEMNVTFATPQHSAMTYRIGAVVESKEDSAEVNNKSEKAVAVVSSETNAELSLTITPDAKIAVHNAGPHDAREVMVVLNEAFKTSGDGWKCKGKLCTLPLLRAGASSTLTVRADAKATVSARVRADRVREAVIKDNGAKVTLP